MLQLRDSGTITQSSGINIIAATLLLDNTGLTDNASRVASTIPVISTAGVLQVNARASTSDIETMNLRFSGGNNFVTINVPNLSNFTLKDTHDIGNLVSNGATVLFGGTNVAGTQLLYGTTLSTPRFIIDSNNATAPTTQAQMFGGFALATANTGFPARTSPSTSTKPTASRCRATTARRPIQARVRRPIPPSPTRTTIYNVTGAVTALTTANASNITGLRLAFTRDADPDEQSGRHDDHQYGWPPRHRRQHATSSAGASPPATPRSMIGAGAAANPFLSSNTLYLHSINALNLPTPDHR